jgi:hypothetical protein
MSTTPAGMQSHPPPLPHADIRALLRAGKNDEAIVRLCAIAVVNPRDLDAKVLLFDALLSEPQLGARSRPGRGACRGPAGPAAPAQEPHRHALQHEAL